MSVSIYIQLSFYTVDMFCVKEIMLFRKKIVKNIVNKKMILFEKVLFLNDFLLGMHLRYKNLLYEGKSMGKVSYFITLFNYMYKV